MADSASKDENLFNKVFDYFGVKWPQLTALSGILFSGFGFNEYINPATWTLASIIAFLLVYTVKEYISDRYLFNVGISILFYVLLGVLLTVFLYNGVLTVASLKNLLNTHSPLISAIIALVVSGNIAILIISYHKHQIALPFDIPKEFREEIEANYFADNLHRGIVRYDILPIKRENGTVTFNIKLRYSLHNFASTKANTEVEYPSPGQQLDIHSIFIGQEEKDPSNAQYYTDLGLRIPCVVPPKDKIDVLIDATETFSESAYDNFTTKLPALGMVVKILEYEKFDMVYQFESNIRGPDAVVDGSSKMWEYKKAILSNQGIRLRWRPTK